jgi:nitrite reductase/ring-hydroxylating ferredoxin subunit
MELQFRPCDVPTGSILRVGDVAVFNVDGVLCATQALCPHKLGPLNEGTLEGSTVTCPWHGSQFDVRTGAVVHGPAKDPLKTYRVVIEGDTARIDAEQPAPLTSQTA